MPTVNQNKQGGKTAKPEETGRDARKSKFWTDPITGNTQLKIAGPGFFPAAPDKSLAPNMDMSVAGPWGAGVSAGSTGSTGGGGGGGDGGGGGKKQTERQYAQGPLKHVGGAGSSPANFAGTPAPAAVSPTLFDPKADPYERPPVPPAPVDLKAPALPQNPFDLSSALLGLQNPFDINNMPTGGADPEMERRRNALAFAQAMGRSGINPGLDPAQDLGAAIGAGGASPERRGPFGLPLIPMPQQGTLKTYSLPKIGTLPIDRPVLKTVGAGG